MIDLETFGNTPDAVFATVGMVYFDPETGELGNTFYRAADVQDAFNVGRKVTASTLKWWLGQSEEAQAELFGIGEDHPLPLQVMLDEIARFVTEDAIVWARGATFDISILENAYAAANRRTPWKFRNVLDVRTLERMCGAHVPRPETRGTHHSALDDAIFQAEYVSKQWMFLQEKLGVSTLLVVPSEKEESDG